VEEIIWDDARLGQYIGKLWAEHIQEVAPEQALPTDLEIYAEAAGATAQVRPKQEIRRAARRNALWGQEAKLISLDESFKIYWQLYEEQEGIIKSGEDAKVFAIKTLSRPWTQPHPEWRGFSIVVSELMKYSAKHKVEEFVIDVHRQATGICYQLFNSRNPDYNTTLSLFEILPLTRLDLAINTQTSEEGDYFCFRNGLLKDALLKLVHLEHLSFHTNMPTHLRPLGADDVDEYWISLQDLLPYSYAEKLQHLKHIGLANLFTFGNDLYQLLSTLPSLCSVDLDTMAIRRGSGSYRSIFQDLKTNMVDAEDGGWKTRRPNFTIRELEYDDTRRTTISDELDDYLYTDGNMPFNAKHPNFITNGFGQILDGFDADYRIVR